MDRREKYVAALLRTLIKKGIITFIGSLGGSLTIGPYGYVLGPVVTVAHTYFSGTSEEEQIAGLSNTELFKMAVTIAIQLALENISIIIEICKDLIRLLRRLFNVGEESVDNARMLLHYAPPN